MKSSNKLLLSGAILVMSIFFGITLNSRKYIQKNENKRVQESGIKAERILLENYQSDTLYLKDIYCQLDPNSSNVKVESDKEYLPHFDVKNYRGIYPYHNKKSGNTYYDFPATFTIGIKGKSNLVIIAKGRSHIESLGQMNIRNLKIEANSETSFVINNIGENIEVVAKNNAQFDLDGQYKSGQISCEYKASIDAMNIEFDSLKLDLSERGFLRVKNVINVAGELEDRATFETIDECNVSGLKFYDNAKHQLESWD